MQALRLCLLSSAVRPSDHLLLDIQRTTESFVAGAEDSTRTVSSACLGTLCQCVEDEQRLNTLVTSVILGIYSRSLGNSRYLLTLTRSFTVVTHVHTVILSIYSCSLGHSR